MNYDPLAELYDLQYAHYRDDLPFYTRLAHDYGGPVLELGAGTGRVAAALARAGFEVVALEPAEQMILRGRARLAREGLEERVTYVPGDMRSVRLGRRFPLVIAPFNTLMHAYTLKDQDATLETVRAHLEAGGRFAFDLYTPRFGQLGVLRREAEWAHVGAAGALERGGAGELFLLQEHDPDAQLITSHYFFDRTDAAGRLTRQRYRLTQRYFTRFELERALLQAGFANVRLYGGFDRTRVSATAPHLVGIAAAAAP
ncbi:class I SAM-dependent methyltransferase [Truepera radiovictrix]|uniref:Methyltransferase type 12 n=1 Tax=Truepera radiovictrix (strain DSM 17093 / CIP 108686 / LMG 22925 / RQ-24) TaxID=649638 RepID=D7CR48_TRURR|nr:class I SAM-dependent methyltransferase [Truepera radiovictrix]ADI13448.1 Methyltransferase type 12 [Truepera radiovictrix DSM 17093]WMT57992.1 class I SAM-dependent methyltransferase [Truepera radiovictrix]